MVFILNWFRNKLNIVGTLLSEFGSFQARLQLALDSTGLRLVLDLP